MRNVAIVGGSLAGVHAAETLREMDFEGEITLLSGEDSLPYDRPPLTKEALLTGIQPSKMLLRPSEWYEDNNITTRIGTYATGLDIGSREIFVGDKPPLSYDGLIIATGSRARRLQSLDSLPGIHTVHDISDATELREALVPGQHLILIGTGFICLEIAATARQLGAEVTVIGPDLVPLARALGDIVGSWFRDLHRRNGVRVECGAVLDSVQPNGKGVRVTLTDGRHIDADHIVAGVGATPATDWLLDSGLELADGVRCQADLSSSAPGVVAAGDVARWYNAAFDEDMRIGHWTNAVEQGRHAASTLLGEKKAFSSVPYFWTDQYNAKTRFVGRADAADQVVIEKMEDSKLVALYGRDGYIRGAVCVNAPKQLAKYRKAINDNVAWGDITSELSTLAKPH